MATSDIKHKHVDARKGTRVVVVSTLLLTFISFWRASAIVLADLASSAYYVLGVAEKAVGPSAPWFVLFVMLFAYGIRAVHIEASSMFVRGGMFKVVREGMGLTVAKFSVSALIFDYIVTGPISAVSAGQYIAGLVDTLSGRFHLGISAPRNIVAVGTAILIVIYFWRKNTKGIEESSGKALRIVQATAVMGVILLVWSLVTVLEKKAPLPAFQLNLSNESLGVLQHFDWLKGIGIFGILVGMGHSLLAISGEETLAQVYREIEAPKLKNLLRTGFIIFIFAFLFTGVNSLFAAMLIPQDELVGKYNDNVLSGLAMHLLGSNNLLLAMQTFVVVIGFLILSGAVNTAIIGANQVLNRVAEFGLLPDWFRRIHEQYGTTTNIINTLAVLQILIIIGSMGNVFLLGEVYAFGVVWSFIFKAYSLLAMRFKPVKARRRWRVPLNLRIGKYTIPVGLGLVTLFLGILGTINLFTKPYATAAGIPFTLLIFWLFTHSERTNAGASREKENHLEKFQSCLEKELDPETIGSNHEKRKIVVLDSAHRLNHLKACLQDSDPKTTDVIAIYAAKHIHEGHESGQESLNERQRTLFTAVVDLAEKLGKPVLPLVVSGTNRIHTILHAARTLGAEAIYFEDTDRKSRRTLKSIVKNSRSLGKHAKSIELISITPHSRVTAQT